MKLSYPILLVEDDENDVLLIKRAIAKSGVSTPIIRMPDGQAAIEYLTGAGEYADRQQHPFPVCIVTDLKMPRKGGMELLEWLSNHKECQVIPTIVLSSSNQPTDIRQAYQLGANCYFVKPHSADQLVELFRVIMQFWNMAAVPATTQ